MIPRTIIQTGFIKKYESPIKNKIIKMNPSYKYEYYNNNDCIYFINKHFSQDVEKAFNKLKPGAFKADLFRYCYLYINGGVYIDLDMIPDKSLDEILIDNIDFISCLEDRPNKNINGIYQGFIACVKNLNFLKIAIDKIVYYTKINYYPKIESEIWISILSVTGPVLLYNSMNFKKRPALGYNNINNISVYLYKFNNEIYNLENEKIITNEIPYIKSNCYINLFIHKNIYNMPEHKALDRRAFTLFGPGSKKTGKNIKQWRRGDYP
jgi:mannosyltransferase OCH1-like enzyme